MRALPLLALALCLGCASEDPTVLTSRLAECGLVSDGEVGPSLDRVLYAPDACYRECLASAACEDLEAALCGSSIELERACDERCAERCDDGGLIAPEAVCDGVMQCTDGSDEAGCPRFTCRDGTSIATRARCNGSWQCPDGSDELECPNVRSCQTVWGGTTSLDWVRCNGTSDCVDGSDELDCAMHRCEDGSEVRLRPGASLRCDGIRQCPDASDERRCATLIATCAPP